MCGIAGVFNFSDRIVSSEILDSMAKSIAHRGPDGQGIWRNENGNVGFSHRRLAVIDKNERSNQPFIFKHFSITYNGEIYNYKELKAELQAMGYHFYTEGDTEVLISAYEAWGPNFLTRLDGMFAFAIYDGLKEELFAARDRFGEKPFFYSTDEKSFVFGSEIKALARSGIKLIPDNEAVTRYLIYDVVEDPFDKSKTFYSDIFQLPPSHYLLINRKGRLVQEKYWTMSKSSNVPVNELEIKEHFRELFLSSIKKRLRADVEIGTSLSGGLDSSSIVAGIFQNNVSKMQTFSARFEIESFDEGPYIEKLNKIYSFNRNDVWPRAEQMANELDLLFYHQEEPFGSSSIYAQWEVMKKARAQNVTVLLDGQGADETLGGYFKYFPLALRHVLKHHPLQLIKSASMLQSQLNLKLKGEQWFQLIWPHGYDLLRKSSFSGRKSKLIASDIHKNLKSHSKLNENPFHSFRSLDEMLAHDCFNYGLGKLLRFSDRNSMAFSREVRLPFLSHELVTFIHSLPSEMKISIPWTKYVLRKSMEEFLPKEICWRTDKKGFTPPQEAWMNSTMMKSMVESAIKYLKEREIITNSSYISNWQLIMTWKLYDFAETNSRP